MTTNPLDFTGKRVLVIGGSSGVGGNGTAPPWRDARVHRIHGATSEIMKEVVSREF
ncbi:MAG: hypothetical protein QNI87_08665 [Erythrobacter sp.]|nr:hypothetical protein [Erythrobacter sp.]